MIQGIFFSNSSPHAYLNYKKTTRNWKRKGFGKWIIVEL